MWEDIFMTLVHTKGNLLDLAEAGEFDVILHGCNCFNSMSGGIAREIRERYSQAEEADSETVRGDFNKLGTWSSFAVKSTSNEFEVLNCYTQYDTSSGGDAFEYTAFQLILEKVSHSYGDQSIGLPHIGMGLAGGDKKVIMAMIDKFAESVTVQGGRVSLVEFS